MLNVSKDFNFAIHIQLRPQTDLLPLSLHNHRCRRCVALLWLTPCGFPALLSAAVTVWRTDPLKRNERKNKSKRWMTVVQTSDGGNPCVCGGTRYDKNKRKEKKLHREAVSERNCCDFYWSRHQPCVPGTRKLFFRRTKCVLLHHTIFTVQISHEIHRKGRSQGLECERMERKGREHSCWLRYNIENKNT